MSLTNIHITITLEIILKTEDVEMYVIGTKVNKSNFLLQDVVIYRKGITKRLLWHTYIVVFNSLEETENSRSKCINMAKAYCP